MKNTQVGIHTAYKKSLGSAISSILFFIIVFLALDLLSVIFAGVCVYFGLALIVARPSFITLMIGGGLAAMGILVFIFLVKFLFTKSKSDISGLIEITREEEPEVFAMIDDIVQKVKTSAPKKVYLTTNVNAAVFYDSSFWSMFLPVRKNLMIGMGLIHSTTADELKAVLSHEFGHFSQRSMKVGSYVYQVNKIIFNLLYENDGYVNLAQAIANINGYFGFFVNLAIKVVVGIQWVLQRVYKLVNLNYMGLSREMEFHADHVAASVTGSGPCVDSLLRLGLADYCFSKTIDFYNRKIKDNIRTYNIYDNHDHVLQTMGQDADLPLVNGIPMITKESYKRFDTSRLVLKDQWASHPETIDRVRALETHNIPSPEVDKRPAVVLLKERARWEEQLTEQMFSGVTYEGEVKGLAPALFREDYDKTMRNFPNDPMFNHYYDRKDPVVPAHWTVKSSDVMVEQLFSQEQVDLVYECISLTNDIETLKQISTAPTEIKSFDYNGERYKGIDSSGLMPVLEKELTIVNNKIAENDTLIYNHFLSLARVKGEGDGFTGLFDQLKEIDACNERWFGIYGNLQKASQFIQEQTPYEQIEANMAGVLEAERPFKASISEIMAHPLCKGDISNEQLNNMESYLSRDWVYFTRPEYDDAALKVFYDAQNAVYSVLEDARATCKRRILDKMVELHRMSANAARKSIGDLAGA